MLVSFACLVWLWFWVIWWVWLGFLLIVLFCLDSMLDSLWCLRVGLVVFDYLWFMCYLLFDSLMFAALRVWLVLFPFGCLIVLLCLLFALFVFLFNSHYGVVV